MMIQNELTRTRNELAMRNYSPKTIKNYLPCLREYFEWIRSDFEKPDENMITGRQAKD